jgi:chemotaxis protein methyltransferase CheR
MQAWSSPGLARIADIVRERTGLVFPAARMVDVEAVVRRAMARRRIDDIEALADLLEHDARVRDSVVAELTIGETYFNRDGAQFDLLRTKLMPHLLGLRADRPVRVWSAGCASGEEPYSIAMLLSELDAEGRAEIVGTDISRQRLQDAQHAIYSKWSLRGMPLSLQQRYFMPRGRYHELRMHIRAQVDFRYLNLAEDHFPSLSAGIWGMDVILCRNVLIYFDRPTVEAVARRLIASLSEDGYLILGASDPAIGELVECDVVATAAGLIYRRAGAGPGAAAEADGARTGSVAAVAPPGAAAASMLPPFTNVPAPAGLPAPEPAGAHAEPPAEAAATPAPPQGEEPSAPAAPSTQEQAGLPSQAELDDRIAAAYERRDFTAVRAAAERAADAGHLDASGWAFWLRALANQGCLEEAAKVAARGVESGSASAELLYLTAVLHLQAGRALDAAAAARRALYSDRGMVVAHLTMAEAQRRLGNVDGARRALRNAGTLLAGIPEEGVVPASDGETAGRLARLVKVKLRLIEDAA